MGPIEWQSHPKNGRKGTRGQGGTGPTLGRGGTTRKRNEGDWEVKERPQSTVVIGQKRITWVNMEGGRPSRLLLLLLDLHVSRAPCSATLLPACSCSFTPQLHTTSGCVPLPMCLFDARASAHEDRKKLPSRLEGEMNLPTEELKEKKEEKARKAVPERREGCTRTCTHSSCWMCTDPCAMLRGPRQTDSLV